MKNEYTKPISAISEFECIDVMTTSGGEIEEDNGGLD